MRIVVDEAATAALLDSVRASFTAPREDIHLSDLVAAPRRAYWQRVLPLPATDDEIGYWVAGRGHEDALGRISDLVPSEERAWLPGEGTSSGAAPIVFRPDFFWRGRPAEFKTRRANLAEPGQEAVIYDSYIEQLRGYCAMLGVTEGYLIVLSLLEGRDTNPLTPTRPEIRVYDVCFEAQELAAMREQLAQRRTALEAELVADSVERMAAALGERRPRIAPSRLALCKPWLCGKRRKTVLREAWCEDCNKELREPWAARHTATKAGAGHTVRSAEVQWDYEVRCKYYTFCRPQDTDPSRGA
jgi:hypothetical protein